MTKCPPVAWTNTIPWKVILRSNLAMPQDVVVWHLGLDSSRPATFPRVTPNALQPALELVHGGSAATGPVGASYAPSAVTRTIR
jgi:hypothetical protein